MFDDGWTDAERAAYWGKRANEWADARNAALSEIDRLEHIIHDALKWLDPGDGMAPAVETGVAVLRAAHG